ncbi:MAG: RAMP superfamily CRISPR-associated protein [Thermodesulfobacteriota bacterium]
MPQNETFWNPYRLVPAKSVENRCAPQTHERFVGHCGILSCTVENLTPLFVGPSSKGNPRRFLSREQRPVIPGSSLKGMFRSLAELVGGGCCSVQNTGGQHKSPVPPELGKCTDVRSLCITCRMFGAMETSSRARVHMGKVCFGDATLLDERGRTDSFQVYLSSCGVRHEPFYRSPHTGKLDGASRKLYFHQPMHRENIQPLPISVSARPWQVDALLPHHRFRFEVTYHNLTDAELSLLLYVIHLEEHVEVTIGEEHIQLRGPLRHKIGNAKPLGMGSCHVQIEWWERFLEPRLRFASLQSSQRHRLEGDDLHDEIIKRICPYIEDKSPTMKHVRKMMVWDETDKRVFNYPNYEWFQNRANSGKPLKAI